MFLSGKEIIFFVISSLVIFMIANTAPYMETFMKFGNKNTLIIMSFLGTLLLLLIYKVGKIPNCQADRFYFQVSKPKLCQGYPYMQSSASPELQNYCNKLFSTPEGRAEYANMNCTTHGFNGRPVHFDYTPESDHKWENKRCTPPNLNQNDPCPL